MTWLQRSYSNKIQEFELEMKVSLVVNLRAYKKLSAIGAWENSRKAIVEAQLKKIEEKLEKKRAEYAEKMNNKKSEIHKAAEEKRVMVEAKRGEDILTVEEIAAKFRSTGNTPKRIFGCFRF
ncbi:remorin 1.4-like [Camellia sinensis]|uniref:remorin 1.4-like n=1 Tax=Camellia sinensis TaxID=4442 RepID=UPI00103664CC|nr:remorin 1.4-like [Camellia sinensis]